MEIRVIDVSKHNGTINWDKVKAAGVEGVIIRCGYGSDIAKQDDERFKEYADECTRLGIPFGVYLYSYAKNKEMARSEAEHALRLVKGYKLSYPLYFDAEEAGTEKVGKENAIVFCEAVKAAGYFPGVYANEYWWKNYLVGLDAYTKWVAKYNANNGQQGTKPSVEGMDMWQYTSKGSCDGVSSSGLDMNVCYRDFPSEINPNRDETPAKPEVAPVQHAHKAGEVVTVSSYYASSTDGVEKAIMKTQTNLTIGRVLDTDVHNPYRLDRDGVAIGWCNDGDIRSTGATPARKSNEEIADEVLAGKWGNQPQRQKDIEAAGYNYETIRALVNAKEGKPAQSRSYYPRYTGSSVSIVDALVAVGADASKESRKKIAAANEILNYEGNASQNTKMLKLLKAGKLIK